MTVQLDFDGNEIEVMAAPAPFTPAQREILRLVRTYGTVTSTAAGKILHAHRDLRCLKCAGNQICQYAASDGGDALKRLMERGLVRRVRTGVWVAVTR